MATESVSSSRSNAAAERPAVAQPGQLSKSQGSAPEAEAAEPKTMPRPAPPTSSKVNVEA